jgi:hypothetical protein
MTILNLAHIGILITGIGTAVWAVRNRVNGARIAVLGSLVVIGIGIGVSVYVLTGPPEGGGAPMFDDHDLVIRKPDGAWCAPNLQAACVSPSGEVSIPSGDARDTLLAYSHIRYRISPAFPPMGLAYSPGDTAKHQTQKVEGRLNAHEVLNRMLEGSGLVYKTVPRTRAHNCYNSSIRHRRNVIKN